MPLTPGILPHPRCRAGRGRRSARRACPARSCRTPRRTRAPRRRQRGALEQPRRRHARREPRIAASSANTVQILDARQAVGADRDPHAGRVEALDRRRAGAGPAVAARAGDERRARVRETRSSAVVSCTPCTASSARVSSPSRRGTRPGHTPAAPTRRSRHRVCSSSSRHAPVPSRRNSTSSADSPRWTLIGAIAARRRAIARNSAGDTEYGACGTTTARSRADGVERVELRSARRPRAGPGRGALKPSSSWNTAPPSSLPASSS